MSEQQTLKFELERRDTLLQRLATHFKSHSNEWIDGLDLQSVAGSYAWRSRLAELRTKLGLDVENKLERNDGVVKSSYMLHMPARQNVVRRKAKNQHTQAA